MATDNMMRNMFAEQAMTALIRNTGERVITPAGAKQLAHSAYNMAEAMVERAAAARAANDSKDA